MRKLAFWMILALLCLALPFACAEEEISYGELFGDPAAPAQLPSAGAQPAQEQMAPTPVPTATPRLEGDGSVLLTITAVGDVTIGRNVQSSSTIFAKELKRQDDDINFIFRNVKDIFAQDDITIVNFEGVLAEDYSIPSKKRNNSFLFLAPTAYAQALPDNGVEIATIENNHIDDFGDDGRASTQQALADVIGKSLNTVGLYERGLRQTSLETLCLLADTLEVSSDYLLARTDIKRTVKTSD